MSWPLLVAIIAAVVAFDALLVVALVRFGWGDLPAAFPGCEPSPDAVSKRFRASGSG